MKTPAWPVHLDRWRAWTGLSRSAKILMEVTVVSLWYQAAFHVETLHWGWIWSILAGVALASSLLAVTMHRLKWSLRARQVVFAAWLVVALFASLKLLLFHHNAIRLPALFGRPFQFILSSGADAASFFHVFVIGLLVLRGVSLARSPVNLSGTQLSFQVGLAGMLLYGMGYATFHPWEAAVGLYLFLFLGLLAMSLTRLAGLNELRGGRQPHFGPGWLAGVTATALAVVAMALVSGWLASSQVIAFAVRLAAFIAAALAGLVIVVLMPLFLALGPLLTRLMEFINRFFERLASLTLPKFLADAAEQVSHIIDQVMPFLLAGRGTLLALVLAVVLLAILLRLRLRDHRQNESEDEDTGAASRSAGPGLLRRMLDHLRRRALDLRLRSPGQVLAAARVRRIYRQLMRLCKKLGAERPPALTPLEFIPRAEALFPTGRADLEHITHAYMRVRYGEYLETMREVEQVERAWGRLRRLGRPLHVT